MHTPKEATMPEPKFTVGQRVGFVIDTPGRIQGYVRAVHCEFGVYSYRVAYDYAPQRQRWRWHREDRLKPAVATEPVYRKCSDLPDIVFLRAIDEACDWQQRANRGPANAAMRWRVSAILAGHANSLGTSFNVDEWPGVPEKIVSAKIFKLVRRGLIDGCHCGCRGDLEITSKGRALMREADLDERAAESLEWASVTFEAAAETWPLFPEDAGPALGAILHEIAHPTPPSEQSGPPWTHTFSQKPPCDLAACCGSDEPCPCNCHKIQPTHTITRPSPEAECFPLGAAARRAIEAEDQIWLYGRSEGRAKALADAMAALHEAWHPVPPVVPGLSRETTDAVLRAAAEAGVRPGGWKIDG